MKIEHQVHAIVLSLLLLSGCSASQSGSVTGKSIDSVSPARIGALFPLTGGLSSYGEAAMESAQLAADEINAEGGIHGRPLEIDFQDHQCDPKTALSLFESLSSAKNISIFTSAACSGTVLAIAPVLDARGALLLGTIVTTPKITNLSPYVFRNWASDARESELFAREIKGRGYRRIGIINEETDYAQGLRIWLEKNLQGFGVEVFAESFASGSTDVRSQLAKLKEAQPEMIFISPQTVTSGDVVLKQLQEIGFSGALFVNDNILKSVDLRSRYSSLLEGAISADYVAEESDSFRSFMERYQQKYGHDCAQTNICAGVYDAINLLADAIRSRGEDADGVRVFLGRIGYDGVSGRISFDSNNDRANANYALFVIRDGMPVRVLT
ncbi:MAG: ABC transporter substrate-binding protein [Nanoarchaeota archaeon]